MSHGDEYWTTAQLSITKFCFPLVRKDVWKTARSMQISDFFSSKEKTNKRRWVQSRDVHALVSMVVVYLRLMLIEGVW